MYNGSVTRSPGSNMQEEAGTEAGSGGPQEEGGPLHLEHWVHMRVLLQCGARWVGFVCVAFISAVNINRHTEQFGVQSGKGPPRAPKTAV